MGRFCTDGQLVQQISYRPSYNESYKKPLTGPGFVIASFAALGDVICLKWQTQAVIYPLLTDRNAELEICGIEVLGIRRGMS